MRPLLALVALGLAGCAPPQEVTQTAESPAPAEAPAEAPPAKPAAIGDTINLAGMDPALEMAVTVQSVVDPATSDIGSPGDRYVGVQVSLANVGTANYSDSPANGATIIDAAGQQFTGTVGLLTDCQEFEGGSVTLSPGDTRLGCLAFELPPDAELATFQFTLDSGFGPETGEWSLGGRVRPAD